MRPQSLPNSCVSNVLEAVLERKLLELEALQREIDALRLAAKIVKDESRSVSRYTTPTPTARSRSELNRDRTEKVLQLFKDAAGRELHADELGRFFGVSTESMKEWMHLRIRKYGQRCPWEVGKHSYSFKLRETHPSDLAFLR